jgi:hypothetical protein
VYQRSVRRLVTAFAIDAHGGGDDQALDRIVDQLFQQDRRPQIIDPDIAGDLIHALADPDLRGEMEDAIDTF